MARGGIFLFGIILPFYLTCVTALLEVPTLQQLCPYSSFCTTGPSKVNRLGKRSPCCLPCSCSDKCMLTGTCCPDKPGLQHVTPVFPCKRQDAIYNKLLNRTMRYSTSDYRVIDRCPEEINNVSQIPYIDSSCYTAQGIEGLIFVSDADTFDLYLNRRCAECHGVKNIVPWNLHVSCLDDRIVSVTSRQERDKLIFESCTLSSFPPKDDIGSYSVCFSNTVDSCDGMIEQTSYNVHLEELCLKYDVAYTVEVFHDIVYHYRNIYCYMCNAKRDLEHADLCPKFTFEHHKFSPYAVTLLLYDAHTPSLAYITRDTECSEMEVVDPFMRTCTDLRCPLGQVPHYGDCMQIGEFGDLTFNIPLRLQLPKHVYRLSDKIRNEFIDALLSILLTNITLKCAPCELRLVNTSAGFVALFAIKTTQQCSVIDLMKEFDYILGIDTLNIHLTEANMSISLYFLQPSMQIDYIYSVEDIRRLGAVCNKPVVYDRDIMTCPYIVYNQQRMQSSGISETAVQLILAHSRNASGNELRICLETYQRAYDTFVYAGSSPLPVQFEHGIYVIFLGQFMRF